MKPCRRPAHWARRVPELALARLSWRSLVGRVFLLLVAGIVLSALAMGWLGRRDREAWREAILDDVLRERVAPYVQAFEATPPEHRDGIAALGTRLGYRQQDTPPDLAAFPEDEDLSLRLSQTLARPVSVRHGDAAACGIEAGRRGPRGCLFVQLRLNDETPLLLRVLPPRMPGIARHGLSGPWPPFMAHYPGYFGVTLLFVLLLLSALIVRLIMRPLSVLTRAADDFGRNVECSDLPETGPSEIRHAAAAFNRMQARIHEHLAQRTQMLSAMTHDLQTPLTRLRLRLEKVDDTALRDRLIQDLNETQARVREGLELARSLDTSETQQKLDVDALLETLADEASDAGQPVVHRAPSGLTIVAAPHGLKRALENLIGNALKYGVPARHPVELSAVHDDGMALIRVRDYGPGIPRDALEKVFEPFYRLEDSRSRETGGTGLGLAIVRNLVERMGGRVALRNHAQGGLEACLWVPLAR